MTSFWIWFLGSPLVDHPPHPLYPAGDRLDQFCLASGTWYLDKETLAREIPQGESKDRAATLAFDGSNHCGCWNCDEPLLLLPGHLAPPAGRGLPWFSRIHLRRHCGHPYQDE